MTEQLATVTIIATGAGNAEKIPPHRRGILSVKLRF